jgi:uncharacterized protein (DUF1778 family)
MVRSGRKQPPHPESAAKNVVINLRLPVEQKRAFTEAARNEGLPLSAWLRRAALREAGLLPKKEG